MVNTNQSIPKYHLIAEQIINMIRDGRLPPGARTLSENDIIKQFGVSNTTARKSLQEIELAGWVTKVKGKGTFVRQNKVQRSAHKILSFTKNMLQAGRKPSTRVLDKRILMKDCSRTINGRRYTLKGPIFRLHRLRLADGVPMMLEIRHISTTFCPQIEKKDLSGSLYEIYEKDYKLRLREIDQMLSFELLGPGVKEFFDLDKPLPAFRVEGVTFCGKEMILEMEDSFYRADQYRFALRAKSL